MTSQSIFHLEPTDRFTKRVVDLNRLYAPEDPLHDALCSADHVGDDAVHAARKALAAIHKGFPPNAPLADQGAFLLRAFAGSAIFPEGNFRTGWDFLGEVLAHGDHDIVAELQDVQNLGTALWERVQATHPDGLTPAAMGDRDEAFEYASAWLHQRLA